MWRDRLGDESGVALISAMFAVVIMTGLAVLFTITAVNESGFVATTRDFELSMHAGEGASDRVIDRINREAKNSPYVTYADDDNQTSATRHVFDPTNPPAGCAGLIGQPFERCWAVAMARSSDADATQSNYLQTVRGDGFAFRPVDASGKELNVIYAVGFTPSRGHQKEKVRVVKLQFDRETFEIHYALHVDCNGTSPAPPTQIGLSLQGASGAILSGNTDPVTGGKLYNADIHVNCRLERTGNFNPVEGKMTAYGAIDSGFTPTCEPPAGRAPCIEQNVPPVPVPDIKVIDLWDLSQSSEPLVAPAQWADLCPNGDVKLPDGTSPCTGTTVWSHSAPLPAQPANWQGWDFQPPQAGKGPTWKSTGVGPGVFYIHEGNGNVQGSLSSQIQPVTIFVSAKAGDGGLSGNYETQGNPRFMPALSRIHVVADRDVSLKGTGTTSLEGVIYVGEQLYQSSTVNLRGAALMKDRENVSSVVGRPSTVAGDLTLTFKSGLNIPVRADIRITAWNELSRRS